MHLTKLNALLSLALLMVLSACGAPPTPSRLVITPTRPPSPTPRNDEEAVRWAITAVDEATADANVDRLQKLWAADAFIADAETGRTWQGWNSILDRYNKIVWPSKARAIGHVNIRVAVTGDTAVAISDSVLIPVTHNDNDRWTLEQRGGKWQITSYTFGLSR